MNITLYQVNPTRGKDSLFMSLAWLREKGMAVDPSIYDKVWDGEVDASDLERVFAIFNADNRPNSYTGRSMSVSDVVGVESPDGSWQHYFCDTIGFVIVPFST